MTTTTQSEAPSGPSGHHLGTVHQFFALLGRKDIDAWAKLWAPDGRIIVFYPLEGFPATIEGREEIVAGFRDLLAAFDTFESELTGLYPAADSDAICVEYRNRATLLDGTVYTNDNIAVFRFTDGLISAYHDYFDPRRFQAVVEALGDE
jgi:ketosteroid isomerase-like protein